MPGQRSNTIRALASQASVRRSRSAAICRCIAFRARLGRPRGFRAGVLRAPPRRVKRRSALFRAARHRPFSTRKLRSASVLKDLHDVGLLVAMIPEFAPVVGRVHHDVYHVYTVDVHSVACGRSAARAGAAVISPPSSRLASRLAAEISRAKRGVLRGAACTTSARTSAGTSHAERGRRNGRRGILRRLGLPETDIPEVQHRS